MTDTTDIKALRERMMQQREAALTGNAPSFEDCELLVCDLLRALTLSNKQLEAERQRADANAQEIRRLEFQWEHRAPTQWAYDQACAALHAQRDRAEKAEAELAELKGDQVPVVRAVNGDMMNKPINLTDHPILQQAFDVIQAIEKCGASIALTNAVTEAGKLMTAINELVKSNEALKGDQVPVAAGTSEECSPDVYAKGVSACLVDIPKEKAEVICRGISAASGVAVDWHYIGGRVHIKAMRVTAPQKPVVLPKLQSFLKRIKDKETGEIELHAAQGYYRSAVIAAIEAAGGIVKDGE